MIMKARMSTAWVIKWYVQDSEFCKKDDLICQIQYLNNGVQQEEKIIAEVNGILKHKADKVYFNSPDEINSVSFFEIDQKITQLNVPAIEYNGFTKSYSLTWSLVGGKLTDKYGLAGLIVLFGNNSERLFLTINHLKGRNYLVIRYPLKDFDCRVNDKLEFLFEDESVLSLIMTESSYFHSNVNDFGLNKMNEIKILLADETIIKISKSLIKEWRIVFNSQNEVRGNFVSDLSSQMMFKKENTSHMLKNLAQSFLEEVQNIEGYEPTDVNNDNIEKEECYVYLMLDTTNNYCKIGISSNPQYRERTLQSEKPTIELIKAKKYPSRLIASSIEKALHESFKVKNLRGEWFDLTATEIDEIIMVLT